MSTNLPKVTHTRGGGSDEDCRSAPNTYRARGEHARRLWPMVPLVPLAISAALGATACATLLDMDDIKGIDQDEGGAADAGERDSSAAGDDASDGQEEQANDGTIASEDGTAAEAATGAEPTTAPDDSTLVDAAAVLDSAATEDCSSDGVANLVDAMVSDGATGCLGAVGVTCSESDSAVPSDTDGGDSGYSDLTQPDPPRDATPDPGDGRASDGADAPDGDPADATPQTPPSCRGGGPGAGVNCGKRADDDCCASPVVAQGTFNRDNNTIREATVSAFRLDRYEITVGRFRAFVKAGGGTPNHAPEPNSGANSHIDGSGWKPEWNDNLSTQSFDDAECAFGFHEKTWNGDDEHRPVNCITWYEAFAFCIWDGGRLPTELEWNYAAAGGSEQRVYPWGRTEPGANADLAIYGNYYGGGGEYLGFINLAPVGSAPDGNGKWGQADLAGSMTEWVLDGFINTYPSECYDCASLSGGQRVIRGGNLSSTESELRTDRRGSDDPSRRSGVTGARCARNL